jgi:hypothetical protein
VATGEQLKALLKSHVAGDDERFRAVALQIAAHNAKKGNAQLAQELRSLLDEARRVQGPAGVPSTASSRSLHPHYLERDSATCRDD